MENIAFIDGQNLHLGTRQEGWSVDLIRFRIYLKDKYQTSLAYYFIGYVQEGQTDLYSQIQQAGFIIVFKEHSKYSTTSKKGNVDTDVVFEIMKNLTENIKFEKILLVSGDGDYIKVVKYLIKKNKFLKVIFPNLKFASSLYKKLGNQYYIDLGTSEIRAKVEKIK